MAKKGTLYAQPRKTSSGKWSLRITLKSGHRVARTFTSKAEAICWKYAMLNNQRLELAPVLVGSSRTARSKAITNCEKESRAKNSVAVQERFSSLQQARLSSRVLRLVAEVQYG